MTVTRGVILAGGKGTRLGELTKVTNKHLLPVGAFPMVYHPLKKMTGAGLKEILLVSGTEHMGDFVELLGSGREYNCRLTYRVQDEAGGIAQALGLAEHFCMGSRSLVSRRAESPPPSARTTPPAASTSAADTPTTTRLVTGSPATSATTSTAQKSDTKLVCE